MPTTLTCDQAIFTSTRTPMGEGYRIIAASRELRPDERQAVTRNSPSHEGLCVSQSTCEDDTSSVDAVAFYALPSGRLCVAISCHAGAEHTGRGGQRVYTHTAIFDVKDFPRCGYNPFNVVRAMVQAGLTTPELKPPSVLPSLELSVHDAFDKACRPDFHTSLDSSCRLYFLQQLLNKKNLLVNLPDGWLNTAEMILLGVPGPCRVDCSFGAGLRFSVGRRHRFDLLDDRNGQAKKRAAGQPVKYLDASQAAHIEAVSSPWLNFVERHWQDNDMVVLARRTSREFADVTLTGLQSTAGLYNAIDDLPQTPTDRILTQAREYVGRCRSHPEGDLVTELLDSSRRALLDRFASASIEELKTFWESIKAIWRMSPMGVGLAQPLLECSLLRIKSSSPLEAVRWALEVANDIPQAASQQDHLSLLDRLLGDFASYAEQSASMNVDEFLEVCRRWRSVRPQCPIVDRLVQRAQTLANARTTAMAPSS